MILVAVSFDALRRANLFDVFQLLNSMVLTPALIPVALGMVYRRTPGWAGWSTVLVGLAAGIVAKLTWSPLAAQHLMGWAEPLNEREVIDLQFVFIFIVVVATASGWFFLTSLWYRRASDEHHRRVDSLFHDMRTPIHPATEQVQGRDAMQGRLVGGMCLVFGGFTLAGAAIPNPLYGRLAFVFIGGLITLLGVMLRLAARHKIAHDNLPNP